MANVTKSALVTYDAQRMFDIVNQVDQYPEFLPWCSDAKILEHSEGHMKASVHMQKGPLDQSFTTNNQIKEGEYIKVFLVDGPFKKLEGVWSFENIDDLGSKIHFKLEYEFSSTVISMVVGPVFNSIANTLVDSFCKRADQLYGK